MAYCKLLASTALVSAKRTCDDCEGSPGSIDDTPSLWAIQAVPSSPKDMPRASLTLTSRLLRVVSKHHAALIKNIHMIFAAS